MIHDACAQVNREHSWPSIQEQLGFDQCAGDEPGRAGRDSLPQNRFSDHIRHVYERFLLDFDQQYALQQVRAQDRMNGPAASVSLQGDVPQSQSAGMQSASTQLMQLQLQSATERVERHRAEIPGACFDINEVALYLAEQARAGLTPVASRIAPIPDDLIAEYTATFETLQSMLDEVESQLPLYAVFMNDESIRKIMLMVRRSCQGSPLTLALGHESDVARLTDFSSSRRFVVQINAGQLQKELLARSPPQCSMPLQLVQSMITQMQQLNRMAQVMLRSMRLTS